MCKTMRVVPVKALFSKKKKKIERTYTTLGGAVSCIGMLDTEKKDVRAVFRSVNLLMFSLYNFNFVDCYLML